MSKQPKLKGEDSRMTLQEYVFFTKRKNPDMETAIRVKSIIQRIAGDKYGTKKGSGKMRSDSFTPYVKPEFWDKAFQEIES